MSRPKVGEVFQNRYLILSELGAGGMGFVFRAKQVDADREVAIKSIRSEEVRDQETIARFYREFQLLAKLIHPNIVTIYGLELDDYKFPFAICELIEGDNLRTLLNRNGPFGWERAVKIVLQIAQAMQFAHENGVIHRDLKPDNVMLLSVPEPDFVKLVDFGLSRVAQSEGEASQMLTATGQLIGSANYMSPEQVKQRADERSDIYSLGCVLFELLSGEYLFDADTPIGVIYKHTNEEPDSRFVSIKCELPKRLLAVLSKMLEKNPQRRYQTMKEIAVDLQELIESPGLILDLDEARPAVRFGKTKLSYFWLIGLLCSLGALVLLASSKMQPPKTNPNKTKNAAIVTLPIRGTSMHAILIREKDLVERELLAKRWLEKYGNGQSSPLDRLIVTEVFVGSKFLLGKRDECLDVLIQISNLLPLVEETNRESLMAKESSYQLLFGTYTGLGMKNQTLSAARDDLLMFKRNQNRIGWLDISDYAVTTMMIWGEYKEALRLYEPYRKNNSEIKGTAICGYFRTLGDLEICLDNFEQAGKYYDKASKSLPFILDKNSHINALTGLALGGSEFSAKSTRMGSNLIGLASRAWYLDKKFGELLFRNGLKLIEEEQGYDVKAKGGEVLSRAYSTARLEAQSWLIFMEVALELELPDAAEKCARMAVLSARNQRETALCLGALTLRLLESGNEMQAKQTFSRLSLCLNKLDVSERAELGCRYTGALLELAARKGFSKSVEYYLSQSQYYVRIRGTPAAKAKPVDFVFILCSASACQVTGRTADSQAYFTVLEKLSSTKAITDVSDDAVLLGIPEDAINEMNELSNVVPDYALVKLVDAYLRNDWLERAQQYLAMKEESSDKLSLALAHFKLGKYFFAHAKPELAYAQFNKAYELYLGAPKPLAFGRGLPLNLRCKLLMHQCKSH